MLFNLEKCHIIDSGHGNNGFLYTMNGRTLNEVELEEIVGVLFPKSFCPSMQLSRGISYRDSKIFISVYKTFV